MTQPLALIYYQKLLPGGTLANHLRDLNYRVHAVNRLPELLSVAQSEGPMLLVMEMTADGDGVCDAIRQLRASPKTAHVPILAFSEDAAGQAAAGAAGATLAASNAAIQSHLEQLLEQVLRLE